LINPYVCDFGVTCEQEKKLEGVEAELQQSQSDLQLAFKRIADLQSTLEDEIQHDSDEEYSDDRSINYVLTYLLLNQCR